MLKYIEIADKMENSIIKNKLTQGEKLPKLADLMEQYNVSKSTIIKALDRLERRGLIYQVQGSGVFVRRPKVDDHVNLIAHNGFTADLLTQKITSKVLSLKKITPPKNIYELFGKEVKEVYEVRRLRYLNGKLLCLEEAYFRADLIPYLNEQIAKDSIFSYLNQIRLEIGFSDKYISVKKLDQSIAKLLDLEPGDPSLIIDEDYYLTSGELFDHTRTTYHYDHSKFFIQSPT